MLQLSVALRDDTDILGQLSPIADAWGTGRYRQLLLHVYSGIGDEDHTVGVARRLKSCLPDATVVGTMSAGEIADGHPIEAGVLVGALLFERAQAQVLRYDDLSDNEDAVGRAVCQDLATLEHVKAVELLLPGTRLDCKTLFDQLSTIDPSIMVFGGYSGGHSLNSPVHYVFDDTAVFNDSLFMTAFIGEDLYVNADKVTGWEPLGLPFTVTKAKGRRLIEIDGEPASDVYGRFLHIESGRRDNAEEGHAFPLIVRDGDQTWLRSTIHFEDDGSLSLYGHVSEGMDVRLSYGNPDSIIETVNARLEALRAFEPQVILIYSCIVRLSFWETCVSMEVEPFARICNATGFHTWGEVIRDPMTHMIGEHNVTLLTVGLREGEAPGQPVAPVYVDDSALRGPVAHLRRLSSLVSVTMGELAQAHAELNELNQQLKAMAERDALTGLYNRGKIEEIILAALDESGASGCPVGLIMCDIDYFKRVNDTFGHQVGDAVLRDFARVLQSVGRGLRRSAIGRWGGEEFFLVLPDMDADETYEVAERLRHEVEGHAFSEVEHVTTSLGISSAIGAVDHRMLFASIDDALYRAKEGGRNRTIRA